MNCIKNVPVSFTFYPLKLELQNQPNEGGTYESTTNNNRINRGCISVSGSISPPIVQGFMKWLATSKQLPTLKSVTVTMRQLLRYFHREGILSDDYSSAILTVRCRKIVPSVYGKTEIEAMLSSFNRASSVGIRNYAMVLMAVRLGMRASDICGLKFKNIHWEKSTIEFVTQKTGKSTVLPLTADVGNAIIKYLKEVRPNVKDDYVFLRMQAPFCKLNPAALHSIVTKAFREAGIVVNPGRKHGPHTLRASLATAMLENEVPLPVISETLSHSNTDTTQIYLKVDMHHLRILFTLLWLMELLTHQSADFELETV